MIVENTSQGNKSYQRQKKKKNGKETSINNENQKNGPDIHTKLITGHYDFYVL